MALVKKNQKLWKRNSGMKTGCIIKGEPNHNTLKDQRESTWMYLENKDAKARLKEFTDNANLTKYIHQGYDVLISPELTQTIWVYFGIPSSGLHLDIKVVGTRTITSILWSPVRLDPNKTLKEIYAEHDWFDDV